MFWQLLQRLIISQPAMVAAAQQEENRLRLKTSNLSTNTRASAQPTPNPLVRTLLFGGSNFTRDEKILLQEPDAVIHIASMVLSLYHEKKMLGVTFSDEAVQNWWSFFLKTHIFFAGLSGGCTDVSSVKKVFDDLYQNEHTKLMAIVNGKIMSEYHFMSGNLVCARDGTRLAVQTYIPFNETTQNIAADILAGRYPISISFSHLLSAPSLETLFACLDFEMKSFLIESKKWNMNPPAFFNSSLSKLLVVLNEVIEKKQAFPDVRLSNAKIEIGRLNETHARCTLNATDFWCDELSVMIRPGLRLTNVRWFNKTTLETNNTNKTVNAKQADTKLVMPTQSLESFGAELIAIFMLAFAKEFAQRDLIRRTEKLISPLAIIAMNVLCVVAMTAISVAFFGSDILCSVIMESQNQISRRLGNNKTAGLIALASVIYPFIQMPVSEKASQQEMMLAYLLLAAKMAVQIGVGVAGQYCASLLFPKPNKPRNHSKHHLNLSGNCDNNSGGKRSLNCSS